MNYYTCETVHQLPKEILDVCSAYTASSKNIYNSALYLIRHLASSYDKVIHKEDNRNLNFYILKDNLHQNYIEILELAYQTIEAINSKRLKNIDKIKSQLDFNQPIKDSLIKLKKEYDKLSHNYEPEISTQTYYKFLDNKFLTNLIKLKEKNSIYKDYSEVSSHIANSAVDRAIQDYKNYLASLKAYSKNKANFLGKPKLPSYKNKPSRLTYELDKNRLTKEGYLARVITKDNINQFGSIKDKTNVNKIYICSEKKELLSPGLIESYNHFSFNKVIQQVVNEVKTRDDDKLKEYSKYNFNSKKLTVATNQYNEIKSQVEFISFKFVPNDKYLLNGQPKVIVQAVLKHNVDLPDDNLLNQILKVNNNFLELDDKKKIKFIQDHFSKIKDNYKVASLDLGVVNHITMTFNIGSKPIVVSGQKYNNYVRNKNIDLDELKSSLIPQAVKDIQSNYSLIKYNYEKLNSNPEDWETRIVKNHKENDLQDKTNNKDKILICLKESKRQELIKNKDYPRLSKTDKLLSNQSIVAVYNHPEYANKLIALNNYKKNYLHKLSTSIIDLCNFNHIQYLVIGKNDLWKQAPSMSKENNKDFHAIAHTELINYIKYKALLFGIVVLVTEESYTSKTSFVNGKKLLKFDNEKLSHKTSKVNSGINKINKQKTEIESINNSNEIYKTNNNKKLSKGKNLKQTKIKLSAKANPESRKENKSLKTTFGGYRQSRGVYVNESKKELSKGKTPHNLWVHADVNASYNIMCKVFKEIKYNSFQHGLSYKVMAVKSNKNRLQLLI